VDALLAIQEFILQFGIHSGNVPTLYLLFFLSERKTVGTQKTLRCTKRLYYAAIR